MPVCWLFAVVRNVLFVVYSSRTISVINNIGLLPPSNYPGNPNPLEAKDVLAYGRLAISFDFIFSTHEWRMSPSVYWDRYGLSIQRGFWTEASFCVGVERDKYFVIFGT